MAYKILYIEDEKNYGSIISELEKDGEFQVEVWSPENLENSIMKIDNKDALIVDFRLTQSDTIVDGPSFAQTFRTKNARSHRDIPIILFSVEDNIIDYYKDYTSQDLFDFSVPKGIYLENSSKYNSRIVSVINGYNSIIENKNKLDLILDISEDFKDNVLDYRIQFSLNSPIYNEDVYAFSSFIHRNLIQSIGVLIGEDVLSSRLGISRESKDWNALLEKLSDIKYSGIFSESYNRWWMPKLSEWFMNNYEGKNSLRRLNASQRCDELKKISGLANLTPLEKIKSKGYTANSSNFWSICKHTNLPIDPVDGFEIYERDLLPWQDKEYISFLGISSLHMNYVKPSEKRRISAIEKSLKK